MLVLVLVDTCCVALLAVLVVGLLRSHAAILRALHDLGAGVGDPSAPAGGHGHASPVAGPLTIGPSLPPERSSSSGHDLSGVTPDGDAVAVSVTAGTGATLLAFLSSGCSTCGEIWRSLSTATALGLPEDVRVVVVTKGPELEIPAEVRAKAPGDVPVVMSTAAWSDYEVPGSPFFVLVDATQGRRVGEGIANHMAQVADLVRRARADEQGPPVPVGDGVVGGGRAGAGLADEAVLGGPVGLDGLDGPAREARNDAILQAAGILPGDPSLYPRRLDDVFAATTGDTQPGPTDQRA